MQVKCTSCGASQNISQAQNCDFCGSVIELESATNNYKTALSGESGNLMAMAETAIEATNWEEALQYFNRVLEKDITTSDAWLGKGIAIVYTSKIGDIKTKEAIAYWKNAIKHASNQVAMGKRVAKEINNVVSSFYPAIEEHYTKFHDLDDSYQELVGRFAVLESAQDFATQIDPENLNLFETGYKLCRRVIDSPKSYASAVSSSALAEGIIGQFSSNEYSRKSASRDAREKINKAESRKKEINEAGKIVYLLEQKYILGIRKINPNSSIKPSGGSASATDEFAIDFTVKTFNEKKRSRLLTADAFRTKFGVTLAESHNIVDKILIHQNLITEEDIKQEKAKDEKNGKIILWIIVIILVIVIIKTLL